MMLDDIEDGRCFHVSTSQSSTLQDVQGPGMKAAHEEYKTVELRIEKLTDFKNGQSEYILTLVQIDHLIQAQSLSLMAHF